MSLENCETDDELNKLIQSTWKGKKECLNISHRNLKVIPADVSRLISVKILLLNNNCLVMPPDEIRHLNKLESLSLENNELTIFPSCLSSLSASLSFLNLSNNPLTCLPQEMGHLKALRSLWLDFTQLNCFPALLSSLTNLEYLSLRGNNIASIESSMNSLQNLQWLSLADNQLSSLTNKETFSSIPKLHTIILSNNRLSKVFIVCPSLCNLNLSKNRLSELPENFEDFISSQVSLNKVDLRSNQFTMDQPNWTKKCCFLFT